MEQTQKTKQKVKGSIKAGVLSGAALAVLAAALAGGFFNRTDSAVAAGAPVPVTIDGVYTVLSEPSPEVATEAATAVDPYVMPAPMRQAAAGFALSGLLAGVIGLFGPNRLFNLLLRYGKRLARISARAAKHPVRAAGKAAQATVRATAKVTSRVLRKPGQFLLVVAGLTLFTFTGISVLDVQWQAGLLAGAGLAGAAFYGLRKTGQAMTGLNQKWSGLTKKWGRGHHKAAA